MSGWIKLHRRFLEWEWYSDVNCSRVFLHLVLKANHKDKNYKGTMIKRGQLLTGRTLLSIETGISEQQIRTALTRLKSTSEITIKATSKGSLVTLVKYDIYQDYDIPSTSTSTSSATKSQPASNQQLTTNKNVKNVKKTKEMPACPVQQIIDLYISIAKKLPSVREVSNGTKGNIKARWQSNEEYQNLDHWEKFFKYCEDNNFLSGQVQSNNGRTPFRASLAWIVKPENYAKIINEDYK